MPSQYLRNLILQGENQHLDFKFEVSDSKKIARSMVAFANSEGGKLLLGVKDNGIIAGVRSEEEIFMIETAAHIFSRPALAFKTAIWKINGKTVVEIDIERSSLRPHFAKDSNGSWIPWVRVEDENILASSVMLKIWDLEKRREGILLQYSRPLKFIVRYLIVHQFIQIPEFLSNIRMENNEAENLFAGLVVLKILDIHPGTNGDKFGAGKEFDSTTISYE